MRHLFLALLIFIGSQTTELMGFPSLPQESQSRLSSCRDEIMPFCALDSVSLVLRGNGGVSAELGSDADAPRRTSHNRAQTIVWGNISPALAISGNSVSSKAQFAFFIPSSITPFYPVCTPFIFAPFCPSLPGLGQKLGFFALTSQSDNHIEAATMFSRKDKVKKAGIVGQPGQFAPGTGK